MLFNKRQTMLIREIIQKHCDGLLHSNLLETTSSQWKSQRKWPLNYIPTAIGRNANNVDKCRKISLALVYLFRQTTLDIGRFCDGGKPILNPPWTYIRRQDGRC